MTWTIWRNIFLIGATGPFGRTIETNIADSAYARAKLDRERLEGEAKRLSQPLSELTLGDLIDAIEEALNKSVVPKLQEIVEAVQQIEQK